MNIILKFRKGLFFLAMVIALFSTSCKDKKQTIREEINLGIKATYANEWKIAIDHFNYVLSIDSTNAEAYLYLGRTYMGKRNYKLAIKQYNKSIELNPKFGEAYRSRAQVNAILGNKDAACHDYVKAEELGVENLHNYTKFCK
jgi:tetratricopeptide (TPR) repeat protein